VGKRRSLALCAVLAGCGLAACAGLSDRRAQDADAHFRMATAALQQPGGIQSEVNRRAAYPELLQALRLDNTNARYRQTLGTFFLYDRDYAAAERETLRAIAMDPNLADAHNNLGLIYLAQGRTVEAAAQFRKALENLSYPTPEFAAFNLGNAEYQLGDYAAAVEAYERSLAILPSNPEGQFRLGMSYARLGRLAEAEAAFAAALEMRPDAPRTRYELGMVLFKLGRRDDAAAQFRRVVELDGKGELGEQSRTYLKLLK
jgi:Tfp pilus assembly protein PilF